MSNDAMRELLCAAANYIDALGGDSKKYRAALAAPAVSNMVEPVAYLSTDASMWDQSRIKKQGTFTVPVFSAPPSAVPAQSERLERAERALIRAGFTYLDGAAEWKPPRGKPPRFIEVPAQSEAKPVYQILTPHPVTQVHGWIDASDKGFYEEKVKSGRVGRILYTAPSATPAQSETQEGAYDRIKSEFDAQPQFARDMAKIFPDQPITISFPTSEEATKKEIRMKFVAAISSATSLSEMRVHALADTCMLICSSAAPAGDGGDAFEISDGMAEDWAVRSDVEDKLKSPEARRSAILDARSLHLLDSAKRSAAS